MIGNLIKQNINKLHAMNSIEGLGWSLIGIFVPIYFLDIGFTLKQVFVYYIIQNIVICLNSFFVAIIGRKINLKKILIIRFPFLILFLILLYNIQTIKFPLYLLAAIDGFQSAMFWFPMHILFAQFVDNNKMGSSIGKLFAIPQFVTMFGPLIGGIITTWFGFKVLFIVASIFFFISFIPILYANLLPIAYDFKFRDGILLYQKYKRYFYFEVFNNIGEEIEGVVWPLFVYLNLINLASVGLVGTLLSLSSATFTLVVGRIADKRDKLKMIRISVIFISAVWILRFIFDNEMAFYVLTVLAGIFYVIFSIPYYSMFYQIAQKEKTAVFFAFREIPVNLARLVVFGFGILLVSNLKFLFLLAALVYAYFIFWKNTNNKLVNV